MKIKAVTRPRKDKQGKVPIYVRIADAGRTRYVSIGLKIKPRYWNKKKGEVRKNDYCDARHLNKIIRDKITTIRNDAYQMKASNKLVNADAVKTRAKSKQVSGDFIAYAKKFAERKHRVNVQTGRRYDGIVSKLESYTGGELSFRELTVTWLKEYMDWLSNVRNNKANTVHANLRAIRAILYAAIREDIFPQERNPFFKITLKQPKVSKTKLIASEVKAFSKQETISEFQKLAKNLFLFSFFTCGMRFRDVATLKNKHVSGTHITYQMNKTGNAQHVEIYPAAERIIDNYRRGGGPEDFVFPLIDVDKVLRNLLPVDDKLTVADLSFGEAPTGPQQKIQRELDRDISSKNAYLNKELKIVAKRAGIAKNISFHVARHSYADIAREKKADLHQLSKSLGHSSLKVTENYLQSLGNEASNEAALTVYEEF
jgi:site-specific recombinase XerD